jgi:arylsulfatase A-like enzyme
MIDYRLILLLFTVLVLGACESEELPEPAPNIVLFFVDDMGWQDTSVPFWDKKTPFNEIYQTPNMERLASDGVKFTQAYATAVCSPTRVSLMTGMNAARHRVTNWTLRKDSIQPMEKNHPTLEFPMWNVNGMSAVPGDPQAVYATPLAQVLNDAGYYTVHSGKAHFGAIGTPGENPLNLGFDVNIAGHAAGAPASYLGEDNYGNGKEGKEVWAVPGMEKYHGKNMHLTEAITQEALTSLDSVVANEQPFFLYMAHYAVHTPIMPDDRFVKKYFEKEMDSTEAKYASMLESMDKSLGDIMDYLDEKKIAENTIILFMSDNGGLSAVARGGEKHMHNKPLASGKGSVYEGGIREPMLVKWPGKADPNTISDKKVIIEDFFPTILEMAGIETVETVQVVDGKSFVPVFMEEKVSEAMKERPLFWHYPNEWGPDGPGIGASSAVRKGDWKFIYFHADRSMELYNLKQDIGETKNLASENSEKARDLAAVLTLYLKEVKAQMPIDKKTGEQVEYPLSLIQMTENKKL